LQVPLRNVQSVLGYSVEMIYKNCSMNCNTCTPVTFPSMKPSYVSPVNI